MAIREQNCNYDIIVLKYMISIIYLKKILKGNIWNPRQNRIIIFIIKAISIANIFFPYALWGVR